MMHFNELDISEIIIIHFLIFDKLISHLICKFSILNLSFKFLFMLLNYYIVIDQFIYYSPIFHFNEYNIIV